jgi:hypothetical protein
MDKTIWFTMLAGGVLLILFGASALESISSGIYNVFTDTSGGMTIPVDKAIWGLAGAWP